jgi:glutamine synthetase
MARKEILPAVVRYCGDLANTLNGKKQADPELACSYEKKQVRRLSQLIDEIDDATTVLETCLNSNMHGDNTENAFYIRDEVLGRMAELRKLCDEAETMTAASYWPFPTYGDLLFGV